MKLLHTSDWHVGRTIRGRSRADEHTAVLAEITAIAADEQVDAVIVAGDLFDTKTPSAETENIVYKALLDLAKTGATVLVIAGNHDSDQRLKAVTPLLELGRVITRPLFTPPQSGGVVELMSRDGRERALLACVPFLSQRWVVRADDLVNTGTGDQQQLYAERIRRIIGSLSAGFTDPDTIHLLVAHGMVTGAELVGSERQGQSVFEYSMSANFFPPSAQYVALGHLHRPQEIASPSPGRYSGSPLQLDFGEKDDVKSVTVVEVTAGKRAKPREVPLTAGRRLRVVEGTRSQLDRLEPTEDWLRVIVKEKATPGLADEIRSLFPTAVDVTIASTGPQPPPPPPPSGRTPQGLVREYLDTRNVETEALLALFSELYDEAEAGI